MAITRLEITGGIASFNQSIAAALSATTPLDFVLLYGEADGLDGLAVDGEVRRARGSQVRFIWNVIWHTLRRRAALVIFDTVGTGLSSILVPGLPRYAVIVHGIELDRVGGSWARRRVLAKAHLIIANSEVTAERVSQLVPDGRRRVRVVNPPISPARTRLWSEQVSSSGWPERSPAVLYVGRLASDMPGKGIRNLIAAWGAVAATVPGAELWVVGDGNDKPALEELARSKDATDRIRFFGYVSDAELGLLYRTASIYAMPSRQEGFGIAYLEAMWNGLPCIASDADAGRLLVEHGQTGLVVGYGDEEALAEAMVSLLLDDGLRSSMAGTARARAEAEYGFDRFSARIQGLRAEVGLP